MDESKRFKELATSKCKLADRTSAEIQRLRKVIECLGKLDRKMDNAAELREKNKHLRDENAQLKAKVAELEHTVRMLKLEPKENGIPDDADENQVENERHQLPRIGNKPVKAEVAQLKSKAQILKTRSAKRDGHEDLCSEIKQQPEKPVAPNAHNNKLKMRLQESGNEDEETKLNIELSGDDDEMEVEQEVKHALLKLIHFIITKPTDAETIIDEQREIEVLKEAISSAESADDVVDYSLYDVLWQCLSLITKPTDDERDEADHTSLSMLLDLLWSQGLKPTQGLCPLGHELRLVQPNPERMISGKTRIKGPQSWKWCGCETPKGFEWDSCAVCHTCNLAFCGKCKMKNVRVLQSESLMNHIKSTMIRAALMQQAWLSLDIPTGMPRKAALAKIVQDIKNSGVDHVCLKALNSALGHEGADKVLVLVGEVLSQEVELVKKGQYGKLVNAWCFRQGGDEYALVVRSNTLAENTTDLHKLYQSMKSKINSIKPSDLDVAVSADKGIKALQERGLHALHASLSRFDKAAKEQIMALYEKHRPTTDNIDFKLDSVGISTGLFVPYSPDDWDNALHYADLAQDAAKAHGKNQAQGYYQQYADLMTAHDKPTLAPEKMMEVGCRDYFGETQLSLCGISF